MNHRPDSAPLLPACKLWERTSGSGRRYLVGRLGGLRVLIFERGERDDGDHSHVLMLGAAPSVDKPEMAARVAGGAADARHRTGKPADAAHGRASEPLVDDPIPF